MPSALVADLKSKGAEVRVELDGVVFDCSKPLKLEELKEAWERIADALPDRGTPAPLTSHRAAELFRKHQKALS